MPRPRTFRWIALGIAAVVAMAVAGWNVSLAVERHRCEAKSDPELLAMARRAAQSAAPEMGATAVDTTPLMANYTGDETTRAKFAFKTLEARPQRADVDITRNCHTMVGWFATEPPLH